MPNTAESKRGLRARAGKEKRALVLIGTRSAGGDSGRVSQGSTSTTKPPAGPPGPVGGFVVPGAGDITTRRTDNGECDHASICQSCAHLDDDR